MGRGRNQNEKQPLISSQAEKNNLENNASFDWVSKLKQTSSQSNDSSNVSNTNQKRKHYTPDLFSKEHIVLEEIPYYTNVEGVSCHN